MATTSITFEHPKGNDPSAEDDGDLCEETIEFTLGQEPADSNYGADADGNRGIYVAGYLYAEDNAPEKCEECGHFYTTEERGQIEAAMQEKAENYADDSWEPPEPDTDLYYED